MTFLINFDVVRTSFLPGSPASIWCAGRIKTNLVFSSGDEYDKKRGRYGQALVDLTTRKAVDLLPDRETNGIQC
jgi:hypothetical protein